MSNITKGLTEAFGRYDRRDAYQRDYDSSVAGMGKRQSQAYQADGGANDEGWDEPQRDYTPKPVAKKGFYFYKVPADQDAKAQEVGLFRTKSGKWYSPFQNTRADMFFGPGKYWEPKTTKSQLSELSNDTLASYKKKAGADATQADKRGDYARGDKRMSGIVKATNKEFDNDAKPSGAAKTDDNLRAYYAQLKAKKQGVTEGVTHSALQGWDEMDASQKRLALDAAGVVPRYDTAFKSSSELDDILHAARVKAQNQEDELNIGASGRRELQRQAKQDFEAQRQQLFKEKMEMERFAWEKANTEAERKHEINKIEKEYLHDLRKLQMAHDHDMQKILHADTHELNKMKAEFNMRQKEREQGKPKPQPPEQQSEPDDGDNFDQDTGEPLKPGVTRPQSNQWHTSQQVGYTPEKPNKNNDVTDVETKPIKPLRLGNSKPVDETKEKQRLDPSCWKGYKKQGTKMKGDTRVNNCVPVKESAIMKGLK